MAKFIVDRQKWYRGSGHANSALLLYNGTRCCIGFVGNQCGIKDSEMLNKFTSSHSAEGKEELLLMWPIWMRENSGDISFAYAVNDDTEMSDKKREDTLKEIFIRNGDEIEFVG